MVWAAAFLSPHIRECPQQWWREGSLLLLQICNGGVGVASFHGGPRLEDGGTVVAGGFRYNGWHGCSKIMRGAEMMVAGSLLLDAWNRGGWRRVWRLGWRLPW